MRPILLVLALLLAFAHAATASPAGAAAEEGTSAGSFTLEQIAAMARAGLDDDKTRAACHAGSWRQVVEVRMPARPRSSLDGRIPGSRR